MTRDQTNGEKPAKSLAGEREPKAAKMADNAPHDREELILPPEILEQLTPPGIFFNDAIKLLKSIVDPAEAQAIHDENLKAFKLKIRENDQKRWARPDLPYMDPQEPTKDGVLYRQSKNIMLSMLRDGFLAASGHINNEIDRTDVKATFWLDIDAMSYAGNLIRRGTLKIYDVRIFVPISDARPEELALNDKPAASAERNPRGAGNKPLPQWPKLLAEWTKIAIKEGRLPASPGEAYLWFGRAAKNAKWDERKNPIPKIAAFREHIKRTFGDDFWKAFGGPENDDG